MPLAVRVSRFGVGNLRTEQLPSEPLGAGTVRVAFSAVALNHRDLLVIRGTYGPNLPLPLIPCSDGAGRVVEVGDDAGSLALGDRVCTHMVPDWLDGALEPQMRLTTLGRTGTGRPMRGASTAEQRGCADTGSADAGGSRMPAGCRTGGLERADH